MKLVVKRTTLIVILTILIIILSVTVAYANPIIRVHEFLAKKYFNNWEDNPYILNVHDCSDMVFEVEKYFETKMGCECHIIIGEGHAWNLVNIWNDWYEFESTNLEFQKSSNDNKVTNVIYGDYICGFYYQRQNGMQKVVPDWEELIYEK